MGLLVALEIVTATITMSPFLFLLIRLKAWQRQKKSRQILLMSHLPLSRRMIQQQQHLHQEIRRTATMRIIRIIIPKLAHGEEEIRGIIDIITKQVAEEVVVTITNNNNNSKNRRLHWLSQTNGGGVTCISISHNIILHVFSLRREGGRHNMISNYYNCLVPNDSLS